MEREEFLKIIRNNIEKNNFHITLVKNGQHPEYSYSIGLLEKIGFELILAGGFVSEEDNELVFNEIYEKLEIDKRIKNFNISNNKKFSLNVVDYTWSKKLMLGVYDYYNLSNMKVFQIIPENKTLDVPDMSNEWNNQDSIWKWIDLDWNLNAPFNSFVITDIYAMKGDLITELTRWEENEWEMFSMPGPDLDKDEIIIVPLGTILGIDKSLINCLDLKIGEGLWRESKEEGWNNW